MATSIHSNSSPKRGVAIFVVLAVIVVVTMLGFMGITMAKNDIVGAGDIIDARSRENAAYTGLSLAVARMEADTGNTRAELQKFLGDTVAPRTWWVKLDPSGTKPFELFPGATAPDFYATRGDSGTASAVQVRVVSMDVGNKTEVPSDGIKITLESVGRGRSGDVLRTLASYRILGLDIPREKFNKNLGVPTHALYLGGDMKNATSNFDATGSVYVSGNYTGNSGEYTVHGKLKIGGNMDLPSNNPQTVDSNVWIGGYLNINSGNKLRYKRNLGVGNGLCLVNDNITVDSSFNLYGTCPLPSMNWNDGYYIRVNGRQLWIRDQMFSAYGNAQRMGPLFATNGNTFLSKGLHSTNGAAPADSFRYVRIGEGTGAGTCGTATSFMGRNLRADSMYLHFECAMSISVDGAKPVMSIKKAGRIGKVVAGKINIEPGGQGWAPAWNLVPQPAGLGWRYGAPDNVVPMKQPQGLVSLGMEVMDTVAAIEKNPPNEIKLNTSMAAKFQRVSRLRDSVGVTYWNMQEMATGRYINKMIKWATDNKKLYEGFLLLWIDEPINITYGTADDKIKGSVLFIVDKKVNCGFNWPPSYDANSIQIIYVNKPQTVGDTVLSGQGSFGSNEFGIQNGDFYGYFNAEKKLNLATKFGTHIHGAIALTVAGSSMELQSTGKTGPDNTLKITLDKALFELINGKLGIIRDPAGSISETPSWEVNRLSGFVVRQSKLQFVPLGELR